MVESNSLFRNRLIDWYEDNKRDLPWRHTRDPYKIWLSEIILQQTRVIQGLNYYNVFVEAFPTVENLAFATQDCVLRHWKGLGYYSRARNLHYTAQYIVEHHNGVFPKEYKDILGLKGIGKYTAAAICSFAYQMVYPAVDGNVIRVLSRMYGITEAVDSTSTLKRINEIAENLIDQNRPDQYNQAIMEFGALYCTSKSPNCLECIFSNDCLGNKENLVSQIPFKAKKIKRAKRYFHYLIISNGKSTLLQRRTKNDIWQGLYQFPLIENESSEVLTDEIITKKIDQLGITGEIIEKKSIVKSQKLTHRDIYARFYHITSLEINTDTIGDYYLVDQKKVSNFALPKIIDSYLVGL